MKLALAILAAAPAIVAGKGLKANTDLSNVQVKADSKTGNKLLSKARRLDGGDDATTWVAGYSLKFHSCTSSQDYYGGYFANDEGNNAQNYNYNGGDQQNQNGEYNGEYDAQAYGDNENGNGYYNNEEREDYQGMYQQKLVHFKLCPSDSCYRCKNGADYVVELSEFVDAMLEAKMTAQEYNCERVRENCWCDNANNKDQCLYSCFDNANMSYCKEAMNEQQEGQFDVQEALECSKLDVDEESIQKYYYGNREANQGYYYQNGQQEEEGELYVGPYCSANGKKILLGVFREETCSYPAPEGIYEAVNYGASLPYAKDSLIDSGCISCKEPKEVDYQNYWDQQDPDEVTDVCSNLYEISGRCEEGLDGYFPYRDISACGYIQSLKTTGTVTIGNANVPSKVFAGIFAVTTACLAALSATLYKRSRRQNVSLAGDAIIS